MLPNPDNNAVGPLEAVSLALIPCSLDVHGSFIRTLTKANFFDALSRTIGWNEARQQQEPRFPARYRMVQRSDEIIGFFCLREEADYFHLHTIQLVPEVRGRGYGTALLQYIEKLAKAKGVKRIHLHVFEGNPAQRLYQRLNYKPIANEHGLILMKKVL